MISAELKAKLEALQAELSIATKKQAALQVEVGRVNARIRELQGAWRNTGEIDMCRAKLEAALRREADADKRLVKIGGFCGGEFVVAKVTPKRIFLREPGGSSTEQFEHSGKRVGYGDPIPPEDVAWILAEKGDSK